MQLKFDVYDYRSHQLPSLKAKKITCQVSAWDIAEYGQSLSLLDLSSKFNQLNPRKPDQDKKGNLKNKRVVRDIKETLTNNPEWFQIQNEGIFISSKNCQPGKDRKKGTLISFDLTDPDKHGVANGGHTLECIFELYNKAVQENDTYTIKALKQAYVWLHIFDGLEREECLAMAGGLNTSTAVKSYTMNNAEGVFDPIKEAIKGQPYENNVSYREGDEGQIDVRDIIRVVKAFDYRSYNNNKKLIHPRWVYTSTQKVEVDFLKDIETRWEEIAPIVHKLPELLIFHDQIKRGIVESPGYRSLGRQLENGKRDFGSKTTSLPFLGTSVNGKLYDGWFYPIFAGFKAATEIENGVFHWLVPKEELVENVMPPMVEMLKDEHRDGTDPNRMGKKDVIWDRCYEKAKYAVKDFQLKEAAQS